MQNNTGKYIVSASRRTDLLACQPEGLLKAITGDIPSFRKLSPENIHTLLISTKDYRNILDIKQLKEACTRCDQVCFNLTITGLGGSKLEPRVPEPAILLERLCELTEYVKDPNRITWCFDPVIKYENLSNISIEMFDDIAQHMKRAKIKRVMAMFYYPYKNSKITPEIISDDEKLEFAKKISGISASLGLDLSFCHIPSFHTLRCVDLEYFVEIHPEKDRTPIDHYRNIKSPKASYCRDAIWDLGWYLPRCKHGCLYCYGNAEE